MGDEINISGIPNLGIPGLSGFSGGGIGALGAGNGYAGGAPQPAVSAADISRAIYGSNFSPQQAQATVNNLYGPEGFGGQTARYAGTGAAYGRATGGFTAPSGEPGSDSGDQPQAQGGGSVFDTGAAAIPYPQSGNYFSARGGGRDSIANALMSQAVPSGDPGGGGSSTEVNGGPGDGLNSAFGQLSGQTPTQAGNQPAIDAVNQFAGRGTDMYPGSPVVTPKFFGGGRDFGDTFGQFSQPSSAVDSGDPASSFQGSGRDFNATFGQMPQSLEDQLRSALGTIDRAQAQPSPPYLPPQQPPASGDTLTPQDRGTSFFGGGAVGTGDAGDALRSGRGWSIAETPPAVQQEQLGNRINQAIFDVGQAGDQYGRSIDGSFSRR
jgi:hypothetical protein